MSDCCGAAEAAANHARLEDELAAKKSESRAQKFRELKQATPASNTRPGEQILRSQHPASVALHSGPSS